MVGKKEDIPAKKGDSAYYNDWPSDVSPAAVSVLFPKRRGRREEIVSWESRTMSVCVFNCLVQVFELFIRNRRSILST